MNRTFRVLHVDGNPLDRALVRRCLERELGGVRLIEAGSSGEFESLLDDSIDVVLSDRVIPGYSGFQVIEAAHTMAPGVPVIVVTGSGSEMLAVESLKRGAADYVTKRADDLQRLPSAVLTARRERTLVGHEDAAPERVFETMLRCVNDHVYVLDTELRFRYVSQSAAAALGLAPAAMIGRHWQDLGMPQQIMSRFEQQVRRVLTTLCHHKEEVEYPTAHGPRYVEYIVTPLDIPGSSSPWVLNVVRDITNRREIELLSRKNEKLLRTLIENVVDWVWQVDGRGTFTYVSPQAERMTGYTVEELLGGTPFQLMAPAEARRVRAAFAEMVAQQRRFVDFENTLLHKAGREVHVETNGAPLFDANGKMIGYMGTCRDVTQQREAEKCLREREEELAHLTRVFTVGEMVGTLAHELNQPLHAINNYVRGMLRHLRRDEAAGSRERFQEVLEQVSKEVDRAARIVAHLREFVRGCEPRRVDIHVERVLKQAIELLWPVARDRGFQLDLVVPATLPTVHADPTQIEQVIVNLVTNAFDAAGELSRERMRVKLEGSLSRGGDLEIVVTDQGRGIAAEVRERIFEPFVTTKQDGLGLGLAIGRSIVESHGGKIWAVPLAPHGVAFHVMLPASRRKQEQADE